MKYFDNLKKIFVHYGMAHQLNKLTEEIGELLLAISKKKKKNIVEEMADVLVILDQFRFHSKYSDRIICTMFNKAYRQIERMETENENRKRNNRSNA